MMRVKLCVEPVLAWLCPPSQQLSTSSSLRSKPCPSTRDTVISQTWTEQSLAAAQLWSCCKFDIQIKIKLLRSKKKFTLSYKDNN